MITRCGEESSFPTSTLAKNKKHNSINYHIVREAAAAGILRVGKEQTESNKADVLTRFLILTTNVRTRLLQGVCFENFRDKANLRRDERIKFEDHTLSGPFKRS